MVARYVGFGDLMAHVADSMQRRRFLRLVISISIAFSLIGAFAACGKRGALEAPPSGAETVDSPTEESAE